MPKLNYDIIRSNISEAREELQKIESRIARNQSLDETDFQIAMQHAFHHLCFAWNIRHVATRRYAKLSTAEFEKWGQYPKDLQFEDL